MHVLGDIFVWWLLSLVLFVLSFPVAYKVFGFLPDRGLGFARLLGLLLVSYFIWIIGFLHYSVATILLVWIGLAALSFRVWQKDGPAIRAFLKEKLGLLLVYEGLFLFLFLLWCYVRMHNPDIVDQEKFMDFAFFNSIARAGHFPPYDPWLAGAANHINYYYFGYFLMSTFARLTMVDPSVSYNLVVALVFALTGGAVFSLAYNLTRALWAGFAGVAFLQIFGNLDGAVQLLQNHFSLQIDWWRPTRLIHDIYQAGADGKGHYFNAWWNNISPGFLSQHGINASKALGDACISEFPYFTLLHGDMHPYMVALPFTLLALGLGLNLIKSPEREPLSWKPRPFGRFLPLGVMALVLSCLAMMNTWDLPAYGLALSLCLLLQQHAQGRLDKEHWHSGWFLPSLALLVAALVLASPFYPFSFKPPVGGVGITLAKTGLYQTLVFWGAFLAVLFPFLAMRVRVLSLALGGEQSAKAAVPRAGRKTCPQCGAKVREGKTFCAQCGHKLKAEEEALPEDLPLADPSRVPPLPYKLLRLFSRPAETFADRGSALVAWVALPVFLVLLVAAPTSALALAGLALCALLLASRSDSPEGSFALIAAALGFALVLLVEWVHLKDTFAGDPQLVRMNTVFKFYFEAWVLFSVAAAYGLHWLFKALLRASGETVRTAYLAFLSLVLLGAAVYPLLATMSVWQTFVNTSGLTPTLDGAAWLKKDYPDDYASIMKLRRLPGHPVVAEAVGAEYTHFARVSSYTGLPCPVGWPGHELQWRAPYYPGAVQQDMDTLYSTTDTAAAQAILKKYDIRYVFDGALERGRYSADQLNKFASFMTPDPELSSNATIVYQARD